MVDVKVSRCICVGSGEGAVPPASCDTALPFRLKGDLDQAFRDEDLLPGVLAVSILVVPVLPFRPVVFGDISRDRSSFHKRRTPV